MKYSISDISKLLKQHKIPKSKLDPINIFKLYEFVCKLEEKLHFLFSFAARAEDRTLIKETSSTNYPVLKYDSEKGFSISTHRIGTREFNYEGLDHDLAFYIDSTCMRNVLGATSYSKIAEVIDDSVFGYITNFILLMHMNRVICNARSYDEKKIFAYACIIGMNYQTTILLDHSAGIHNYIDYPLAQKNKLRLKLAKEITRDIPLEYFRFSCPDLRDDNKIVPFERLIFKRLHSFGICIYDIKKSLSSALSKRTRESADITKLVNSISQFSELYKEKLI